MGRSRAKDASHGGDEAPTNPTMGFLRSHACRAFPSSARKKTTPLAICRIQFGKLETLPIGVAHLPPDRSRPCFPAECSARNPETRRARHLTIRLSADLQLAEGPAEAVRALTAKPWSSASMASRTSTRCTPASMTMRSSFAPSTLRDRA